VAEELARFPNILTIVVCGEVRPGYFSIGGTEAVKFLSSFRADKAFIATDAWNIEGTFNSSIFEVEIKRTLLELASKRYLLADHTKFGKNAFVKVSDINVFDAIVTDQNLPKSVVEELKKLGVDVIYANDIHSES
ncbi:MAG: DeoR/GlpR family DNA-binding transcription regulator, partial [Candidatus Methanomethylicaceae archaeon]